MSEARHNGLLIALIGTLVLTPDAMFMRLSQMDGLQMVAWRGLLMGGVMLTAWCVTSKDRAVDLGVLGSRTGLALVICQIFNSLMFCLGIAIAPATIVLLGVATVPVFAAILGWLLLREPTRPATWVVIAAVMGGIVYAISEGGAGGGLNLNATSALGALLGLGVAVVLALNFVIIRNAPQVPILLTIGSGAFTMGLIASVLIGPAEMLDGRVWAMAITGGIILPASFFMLSLASRYTAAANVSLLMLLETVLGPVWVWYGIGEEPTARMITGGAVVVVCLAIYLWVSSRGRLPRV